ncbi:MAG: ABC transporter ATP-binding protein [Candidatus Cloacimonetes bacterium]|nr:ABC transporter ATP-binding protein [Candidatus Cloacimonadota bacterium]
MPKLIINNLKKTYPNGTQALKGIDLSFSNGMYGLLGPNGSGKSTLMRTIATLQDADEGTIFMDELDVLKEKAEVRKILGFLPQEFDLYPKATAYELLEHLAILKGLTDKVSRKETLNTLLERTNLISVRNQKLGSFSGGMKQRFGVAQALLNKPKILIVDEPTAGLDPVERVRFLNILSELAVDTIVIISTHIVEDVSELCVNMAIMNEGKVLVESKPDTLIAAMNGKVWKKLVSAEELAQLEAKYKTLYSLMLMGNRVTHIYSETDPGDGFESTEPDLKDVYFYYIKGMNDV